MTADEEVRSLRRGRRPRRRAHITYPTEAIPSRSDGTNCGVADWIRGCASRLARRSRRLSSLNGFPLPTSNSSASSCSGGAPSGLIETSRANSASTFSRQLHHCPACGRSHHRHLASPVPGLPSNQLDEKAGRARLSAGAIQSLWFRDLMLGQVGASDRLLDRGRGRPASAPHGEFPAPHQVQ